MRAVPNDGQGNEVPAQDLTEQVGRILSFIESPGRKVPQRYFTIFGLIDGQSGAFTKAKLGQKSVVGAGGSELTGNNFPVLK
jgi:hypothetical protein